MEQIHEACPVSNFYMIANVIDDLGLTVYEHRAYCAWKRIAGEESTCFKSNKNIAKTCGMSLAKYKAVKKKLSTHKYPELNGKTLINIIIRQKKDKSEDTTLIVLNNIWPENKAHSINSKKSYPGHVVADPGHDMAPKNTPLRKPLYQPLTFPQQQQQQYSCDYQTQVSNEPDFLSAELLDEMELRKELARICGDGSSDATQPSKAAAFSKSYRVPTPKMTVRKDAPAAAVDQERDIVEGEINRRVLTNEEKRLAMELFDIKRDEIMDKNSPVNYLIKCVTKGWAKSKVEEHKQKQRQQHNVTQQVEKDDIAAENYPVAEKYFDHFKQYERHGIFHVHLNKHCITFSFWEQRDSRYLDVSLPVGLARSDFESHMQMVNKRMAKYLERIHRQIGDLISSWNPREGVIRHLEEQNVVL